MAFWKRKERERIESLAEQQANPELLAAEAEANEQPSDPGAWTDLRDS